MNLRFWRRPEPEGFVPVTVTAGPIGTGVAILFRTDDRDLAVVLTREHATQLADKLLDILVED